jgi:hypothetical protein
MHQVIISEKQCFDLPSRLDELNAAQLRKMMWLINRKLDSTAKAKLIVLVQSLSLPIWKRLKFQFFYFFKANTVERADILFLTQSFHQFDQLTTQKIEKIGGTSVLLYGPETGLANCSFWEFIKAEKYYLNYTKTQDKEWLNKMIATLYRPKKTEYNKFIDTDIRIPLSDQGIRHHLREVEKTDLETKLTILKWFDSCRNSLAKNFPLVFSQPKENHKTTNPIAMLSQGPSKGGGWMQLISELAGSMDNYEKIGNTNLIIALTDITHRIKKSNEAKAQANKRRK